MDNNQQDQAQQTFVNQPVGQAGQQSPVVAPGTGGKEQLSGVADQAEFITPSEQEPNLSREEKEFGVETVSEHPRLTKEHEKIGIKPSGASAPVSAIPSGMIQLPMTQAKATGILKMHKKVTDSILWLATLVLKQIRITNK